MYGGSCITKSSGNRCQCRWGDRGATCAKSAWTFQPLAYIEHSDVVVNGRGFGVELDVATVERQALVLLASAGQRVFVSVELVAGRVRLSYRSNDGFVQRVEAPGTASDGLWHHVVASITNTVCELTTRYITSHSQPSTFTNRAKYPTGSGGHIHLTILKDISSNFKQSGWSVPAIFCQTLLTLM